MAVPITELMQTYDQSDSNAEVVAEGIHMISPTDTPLQLIFPKVNNPSKTAKWIEDGLNKTKSALSADINASVTTIPITAGDGLELFPEDVASYNATIRIGQEVMLVTARAADSVTATRGYGDTTAALHTDADALHVISILEHEGDATKKPFVKARTKELNYLQTFSKSVLVTGIQEAVRKLGGVTSEIDQDVYKAMSELALELERTMIMGVKAQIGDGSAAFRTMAGLWAMIVTNRTSDSGGIDTTALDADILAIWEAGGHPTAIVTSGKMAKQIADLWASFVTIDVSTTIGGISITSIVHPLSGPNPIAIVPHRLIPYGEYYMLDTTRIAMPYLRAFNMVPKPYDGDAEKRWIGGDYSLQLTNEAACAYRYGFS